MSQMPIAAHCDRHKQNAMPDMQIQQLEQPMERDSSAQAVQSVKIRNKGKF